MTATRPDEPQRLATGIPGLDAVLRGGLVANRSYLIVGRPGTGKTTLGNQTAHDHARHGGSVLYVTLLAEAHDRMLGNLAGYAFFDPALVGDRVRYISLLDGLVDRGLPGFLTGLRELVLRHRASLLVVDGSNRLADFAASRLEHDRFLADLLTQLTLLGCTTLLLATPTTDLIGAIGTHADGVVELRSDRVGAREVRFLHVIKCRGTAHLLGEHELEITPAGVEVFPRLEATHRGSPASPALDRERRPFGIPGLDGMLGGGLLAQSTTLVFGPVGSGKTLTGLHFIAAGAERGEPGLIASFQESPPRLVAKAHEVGLNLGRHVDEGGVRVLWSPSLELLLDAWAHDLLAAVAAHRPARLLVDTITDAELLAPDPSRLPAFTAALVNALTGYGVTSIFNASLRNVAGGELSLPIPSVAGAIENVLLLRYVELGARLRRLVSILKSGESRYDNGVREFVIGDQGMDVAGSIASADALLGDAPVDQDSTADAPARPRSASPWKGSTAAGALDAQARPRQR